MTMADIYLQKDGQDLDLFEDLILLGSHLGNAPKQLFPVTTPTYLKFQAFERVLGCNRYYTNGQNVFKTWTLKQPLFKNNCSQL